MRQGKKIALVFSGQSRFALQGARQVQKYISSDGSSDVDIFFHTWEQESNAIFPHWIDSKDLIFVDAKSLISELKPKKYLIESQDVLPEIDLTGVCLTDANPRSIFSMFYSMHEADKLRQHYEWEQGFKYDLVIRSRFDYFPIGKMAFENVANNVCIFPDLLRNKMAYCDWFFWGNSDAMTKVQNVIENFSSLIDMNVLFCGEELLKANLNLVNVDPVKIKSSGYLIRDQKHINLNFGRVFARDSLPVFLKYSLKNFLFRVKNFFKSIHFSLNNK